ncbi:hypothetical protein Bca101_047977 [Brassica carinata]
MSRDSVSSSGDDASSTVQWLLLASVRLQTNPNIGRLLVLHLSEPNHNNDTDVSLQIHIFSYHVPSPLWKWRRKED